MKVLHVSSFGSVCGIADYTEDLLAALGPQTDIENVKCGFIRKEVEKSRTISELKTFYMRAIEMSKDFDVVHVQHEYGFFGANMTPLQMIENFAWFLRSIKSKRVVITFHSGLFFYTKLTWKNYFLDTSKETLCWRHRISPLLQKSSRYCALVHNVYTKELMVECGADPRAIFSRAHPMKTLPSGDIDVEFEQKIKTALKLDKNSVVLSTIGFVADNKGIMSCLEALALLPENYKLIIGGGLPDGAPKSYVDFYKNVQKTIVDEGLSDRVYITGYLKELQMRSLFELTDIFLFLYKPYFSSSGAITIALQSRKPILASNIKSFLSIQKEGKCLEITFTNPAQDIAERVVNLHGDAKRKAELVANMDAYCRNNTWIKTGEFTAELYRQQMKKSI